MRTVDGIRRLANAPARRGWGWIALPRFRWVISTGLAATVFVAGILTLVSVVAAQTKTVWAFRDVLPSGRYLVLLQNNAELRPSGGFIGTIATVELSAYGPRSLAFDTNIYKRDHAFTARHAVTPPAPLQRVTERWALRDSNWAADFRDAATQVLWFYEQEGGEPVDGVIAVNASVIRDFVELIGEVPLSDGTSVTAASFFDVLHYKVEKEYFYDADRQRENEPKSVLRDLYRTLAYRALSPAVAAQLPRLLAQELDEKHILLYHTDEAVQASIVERGWAGALPAAEYPIAIVNANVGGQKSSLNVAQRVELSVRRDQSGAVHELAVTRTHRGDGHWPDGENTNYLRALLPAGSNILRITLNDATLPVSEHVSEEHGLTAVGAWVTTLPQQSSQIRIEYTLPRPTATVTYIKQPGVLADQLGITAYGIPVFSGTVTTDRTFTIE